MEYVPAKSQSTEYNRPHTPTLNPNVTTLNHYMQIPAVAFNACLSHNLYYLLVSHVFHKASFAYIEDSSGNICSVSILD